MGLEKELRRFRDELDSLIRRHRQGPRGGSELEDLSDDELDRLDSLLERARLEGTEPRIPSGGHHPGANERAGWQCDCSICSAPTEPLTPDEWQELDSLLRRTGLVADEEDQDDGSDGDWNGDRGGSVFSPASV